MKGVFFVLRLFILCILTFFPLLHPSLLVFFDARYIWLFCVVLPVSMLISYFYTKKRQRLFLIVLLSMLCISIFIQASFSGFLFLVFVAAVVSSSTIISFRFGFYSILCVEPFFVFYYLFRFFDTLRASSAVSDQGAPLIVFLSVFCFAVWSLSSFFIAYLSKQNVQLKKRKAQSKGPVIFSFAFFLGILAVLFFFPPHITDYIYRIPQKKEVIKDPPKGSDGRIPTENNRSTGTGSNRNEGKARLFESAAESWQGLAGNQGGSKNRYLLMIVASNASSLYMAQTYSPILDPLDGFVVDPSFFLNALNGVHFLETWQNPSIIDELYRDTISVSVFTSLRETYVPWLPLTIEPTVYNERSRPLSFQYEATSLYSSFGYNSFFPISRELSSLEKEQFAQQLSVPFDNETTLLFQSYLKTIVNDEDSYTQRIQKIIESFASFTYEESGRDFIGINELKEFFFETQIGDCSEFSAAAAVLARMAGIPSRVVTGYAITKEMQTDEDRQAINILKERFPPIQDIPLEYLNMITTSEAHAWPQFYVPQAGWIDFEPTQYAQVESLAALSRSNDLVIPIFSFKESPYRNVRKILFVFIVVIAVLAIIFFLYLQFRYWIFLFRCMSASKRRGSSGIKAHFRLFLLSLRARKYMYKKPSQTPFEYSCQYPVLERFVVLYERVLYHPSTEIQEISYDEFLQETSAFLSQTRTFSSVVNLVLGWSLWRYVE